jgi:16S rRNA (adenine(1408)-N(1))-methyltransferase
MAEASRRAAAKQARGGVENAMFLQASLETLGGELNGLADGLTVNFPWGSLLRAVALPQPALLQKLAALAKPGAELDVLVNLTPLRDAAYVEKLGLAEAALLCNPARMRGTYAAAGWTVKSIEEVTGTLIRATRWGSQLHHAGREVWRVRAVRAR